MIGFVSSSLNGISGSYLFSDNELLLFTPVIHRTYSTPLAKNYEQTSKNTKCVTFSGPQEIIKSHRKSLLVLIHFPFLLDSLSNFPVNKNKFLLIRIISCHYHDLLILQFSHEAKTNLKFHLTLEKVIYL